MKIPSVCCETIRRVAFSSSGIFTAERVAVNPSVNSTRPLVPMFAREMAIIPSFLGNFCTSPVGIGTIYLSLNSWNISLANPRVLRLACARIRVLSN